MTNAKATPLPSIAKQAEATIRYFEDLGREVVGVTIKGREFSLDFQKAPPQDIPEVDMVDMSK